MRYISSGTSAVHAPGSFSPPLQKHLATQSLENRVVLSIYMLVLSKEQRGCWT